MIIVLLAVGVYLLFSGISEHKKVTCESFSSPKGVVILGDNDTIIENMRISLDRSHRVIHYEEGWVGATIEFNSSCKEMKLLFSLPRKIDSAHAINYTKTSFFYFSSSHNESTDNSNMFLSYISSEDENWIRITFDWRVYDKISYDQYKIGIAFENPYFGKPLFQEVLSVWGLSWIPKIDKLTVQIKGDLPVDLSYTNPQPSYYYLLRGVPSVYWTFDSRREVSSVQAVFKDPALSERKSDKIFYSGLFIAFGISTILWGLREITRLLDLKKTAKLWALGQFQLVKCV